MPEAQGPGVKGLATTRRQLRQDLRRLRESAQLPQAEVAHSLDWSHSKLIRIENGSVGVSVTDVKALATLYHAPPEWSRIWSGGPARPRNVHGGAVTGTC
jgi:transcriptional regulator with XRE-family HTH domain